MSTNEINSIEAYVELFPEEVQNVLIKLRQVIKTAAPEAKEALSYGIPSYKTYNKPLVYFAAYKKHIGLYAMPSGQDKFNEDLAKYKQGKGSVQFHIHQEMPYELIERIVLSRINEKEQNFNKKKSAGKH